MKNFNQDNVILLFILLCLGLLFIQNTSVKESIILGGNVWFLKVFPSLFPMFIISNLLITYHFPEILARRIGPFFIKIFHTSSYGVFVFFMSLISGTPTNAVLLKDLVEKKRITEQIANELIPFTFFSNPLFLISMLSFIFPNQFHIVLKLILIHYGTNLIIGFLFRPKKKKEMEFIPYQKTTTSFGFNLTQSIKKSMSTLTMILGTICFYFMIGSLIPIENSFLNTIWKGFLELTQGLNSLVYSNISSNLKEMIALSFINFGGISIHTQINCIIADTNISYLKFLKGRIIHVLIGATIAIIT